MQKPEREPWVTYLEHDVLGKETSAGLRVYEVVIKVRHTGLLAVVKARSSEVWVVGFVGAGRLVSLARKIREMIAGDDTRWREDQYAQN